MKLEVGMYIRTKDGDIDRVVLPYKGVCANPLCNCKHISCERNYYDEDVIKKASNKIIDLIEVGDYVDGMEVTWIDRSLCDDNDLVCHCGYNGSEDWDEVMITEEDIETIVTKELFKSVEYRIEDDKE